MLFVHGVLPQYISLAEVDALFLSCAAGCAMSARDPANWTLPSRGILGEESLARSESISRESLLESTCLRTLEIGPGPRVERLFRVSCIDFRANLYLHSAS